MTKPASNANARTAQSTRTTAKSRATKVLADELAKPARPTTKPAAKPAAAKSAAAKSAKSSSTKAKPATKRGDVKGAKLSTESDAVPSNLDELRQLIKITRDRRWRASRRDDQKLVAEMQAKLDKLTAVLKEATSKSK